jgi:hypothetical protein
MGKDGKPAAGKPAAGKPAAGKPAPPPASANQRPLLEARPAPARQQPRARFAEPHPT